MRYQPEHMQRHWGRIPPSAQHQPSARYSTTSQPACRCMQSTGTRPTFRGFRVLAADRQHQGSQTLCSSTKQPCIQAWFGSLKERLSAHGYVLAQGSQGRKVEGQRGCDRQAKSRGDGVSEVHSGQGVQSSL